LTPNLSDTSARSGHFVINQVQLLSPARKLIFDQVTLLSAAAVRGGSIRRLLAFFDLIDFTKMLEMNDLRYTIVTCRIKA